MIEHQSVWNKKIVEFLKTKRGFDFSGSAPAMIGRKISLRMDFSGIKDQETYLNYLKNDPAEIDLLIESLTVNFSSFFRDAMSFNFLKRYSIPEIVDRKLKSGRSTLRVWSAGCSGGEEAYSVAILIKEFIKKNKIDINVRIIGTDINNKILANARRGIYESFALEETYLGIIKTYFKQKGEQYCIKDEIKQLTGFHFHDLLDRTNEVPPESIFGSFDIVLCRNVLIYFNLEFQKRIFNKLLGALAPNGILVLGEVEIPPPGLQSNFTKISAYNKIYRKMPHE